MVGCGARDPLAPDSHGADTPEHTYRAAPRLDSARRLTDGSVALQGVSAPGSVVRLASPQGEAIRAETDGAGRWTLSLRRQSVVRLMGLSTGEAGRRLQSEGYLAITPEGRAAVLRAGAGARTLWSPGTVPRILAIDFDRQGGTVVSGQARPGDALILQVDGAAGETGRADVAGRFSMALDAPLASGAHNIRVGVDGRFEQLQAALTPAAPLLGQAYRASATPLGWRIDWTTPGGGLQSTILADFATGQP